MLAYRQQVYVQQLTVAAMVSWAFVRVVDCREYSDDDVLVQVSVGWEDLPSTKDWVVTVVVTAKRSLGEVYWECGSVAFRIDRLPARASWVKHFFTKHPKLPPLRLRYAGEKGVVQVTL